MANQGSKRPKQRSSLYEDLLRAAQAEDDSTPAAAASLSSGDTTTSSFGDVSMDDDFVQKQLAILREFEEDSKPPAASTPRLKDPPPAWIEDDSVASPVDTATMQPSPLEACLDMDIDNEDLIAEQQRILDEIERQKQQRSVYSTPPPPSAASRSAPPAATNKAPRDMEEDYVTRLSNGRRIRFKGTRHTYRAIEQGQATLVQCFSCQAVLQVPVSTKALYCPLCQQITSMELAGCHRIGSDFDADIAESVQQQEIHVAAARKLDKLDRL